MRLHNLKAPKGANRKRKRIGRGESSNWGKTAGKGMGGQKKRSGTGKPGLGFEGGQMPMYRRMPKRGFVNIFAKKWAEVNLDTLATRFAAGATVDLATLREAGVVSGRFDGLRILGRGEIGHALTITANHVTAGAKQKIEAAGGNITLIDATAGNAGKEASSEATE